MKNKIRKRLVRFLLIPLIALILILATAFAILYSQQQRLVKLAIKEFNKRLPGEVLIDGSNIALFQNFPYVSIRLNNVRFYATKQTTVKPLFAAERLFVGFSLPDVLKQKYSVKVIFMKNGQLDLVEEKNGELNIVEASRMAPDTTKKADTTSTALDLDIKKIVLKNMTVSFNDLQTNQKLVSHIERIQSSLEDDSVKLNADLKGKMVIDYTSPGNTALFKQKHIETDFAVDYEKKKQLVTLSVGKLKVEEAVFNITGTADLAHDNTLNFKFSGDKPDLKQLFAFAPATVAKELKHFKYDGVLDFTGTVKGSAGNGHMPRIDVSFSCAKAWLHNAETDKKLDSIAFQGYYTNGDSQTLKTSEVRLLNMHARPGKGIFDANFVMRDFSDPKILMQVNSNLELEFIGKFLGIKDLQRITGEIDLKMNFKDLIDISAPEKSMGKLTEGIQSELTVRNLTFRIPSYPYNIEHLNLHANMKEGFVRLDSMACNIGHSDFYIDGSISDLPAIFHAKSKPVIVTLNAHSNKMVMRELMNIDTAKTHKGKEEIYGFNVGLSLETSVDEVLHPKVLPDGSLKLTHLNASFKNYPHAFHDIGAELTINDTMLRLKNFGGHIDSSDFLFSGRVNNYALWMEKVKKGKTEIAFDFKSQHLAMSDVLGRKSRNFVPVDYRDETGSNIWLRSKTMLRYDTAFKFANIKIANISGRLKKHAIELDSISGNVKFGTDNFIKIDTLRGKVGNSDFNLSMRLYTGKDSARKSKENYLQFASRFLDIDQLTNYALSAEGKGNNGDASNDSLHVVTTAASAKPSVHAKAFNIFQVPFIDFNASVNIGKIRYHRLWMKNVATNLRMLSTHHLYLDTLHLETAGGKIDARAHFNGSDPNKIYLRSRINVDNVDLEKMMLKLDYFGQDYVINKNVKGRLTGQIKSYVLVHPDLTPQLDQLQAQINVNIFNGELINFAPMSAMSSYFKDKNLNRIRFDTLRNVLTLKDNTLQIPSMNINSSLGFIEIAGSQGFDMKMEYYLRIPLKMVTQVGFHMLFGKKREEVDPDQVDAIEYRDKDKKVRFMSMTISGTPDDYKVKLGKPKKA